MASESVLKIVVDDKEYNASLKQAQQGLQALEKALGNAGESFEGINKSVLDYTRAIGKMDAQAKTAKGRIGEMSNAFVELSSHYNRLTDAEKNSPFGQALSESLKELQTRIHDSTNELHEIQGQLQEVSTEANDSGGILDALSKKVTLNVDAFKLLDLGLGAVSSALGVAKDAFFASEANVDEWGKIVQSANSVYDAFLNALNNGDISGFLGRIDEIVAAARAAYDELDRLGTMQTIQKPEISRRQTENDRLRQMIMTRRYIPRAQGMDLMFPGMKGGQLLNDSQVRMLETMLQSGINKIVDLTKNEAEQASRSIDAFYNSFAKDIGMSVEEFRRGTSSMDEFDKRVKGAQAYSAWQLQNSFVDQQTGRLISPRGGNPYAQFKGWDVFRVDGERYNNLVNLILQRDQKVAQTYSLQSQAYRTMNRAEGVTSRIGGRSTGAAVAGGGSTGAAMFVAGSVGALTQEMRELQAAQRDAINTTQWQEYQQQIDAITQKVKELKGELGLNALSNEKGISISSSINDAVDSMQKSSQTAKINPQMVTQEKMEVKLSELMGNIAGGVSSMVSGIEGLGIEIPKGLKSVLGSIQAVAAILSGISALVTVITTLQGVKSIPVIGWALAHGGVVRAAGGYRVPGTAFSGDMVPARLNAGEVVLNQAQAGVIASNLQGQEFSGGVAQPYTDGERIYLGVETMLKRKGKGEIVTTSMLRQMGLIQ